MAYRKIFDNESASGPMMIDVYFSGGASSVVDMINNPDYGTKYKIRAAFTNNENASGIAKLKKLGINAIVIDHKQILYNKFGDDIEATLKDSCGRYYTSDFKDNVLEHERELYDAQVLDTLEKEPGSPDLVCLSGYMRILSPAALSKMKPTINVHPARLSILTNGEKTIDAANMTKEEIEDALGKEYWRLLGGENVVSRAITYGYPEINASIHLVNNVLDGGPLLVLSPTIIANPEDAEKLGLQFYSDEIQGLLKGVGDSPAYFEALEAIADGRVEIDDETGEIRIDGKTPTYGGVQMEKRYTAVLDPESKKVSLRD